MNVDVFISSRPQTSDVILIDLHALIPELLYHSRHVYRIPYNDGVCNKIEATSLVHLLIFVFSSNFGSICIKNMRPQRVKSLTFVRKRQLNRTT